MPGLLTRSDERPAATCNVGWHVIGPPGSSPQPVSLSYASLSVLPSPLPLHLEVARRFTVAAPRCRSKSGLEIEKEEERRFSFVRLHLLLALICAALLHAAGRAGFELGTPTAAVAAGGTRAPAVVAACAGLLAAGGGGLPRREVSHHLAPVAAGLPHAEVLGAGASGGAGSGWQSQVL